MYVGVNVVRKRWIESFGAFMEDMGPRPSLKHSIDRIDSAKGYEPGNCLMEATVKEQANHMSRNRMIEHNGAT